MPGDRAEILRDHMCKKRLVEFTAMKPEFMEKAVEGRVRKVLEETCLMTQPFVKDPNKTVEKLLKDAASGMGGTVTVRRFARFVLGEGLKEAGAEEAAH
jgi:elongation factor Ts